MKAETFNSCIKIFLVGCVSVLLFGTKSLAQQPTSHDDQLIVDNSKLDHLEKVFATTPQFGEAFWVASRKLGVDRGPNIIRAIMVRSRKWKNEEGLVFVPLVAMLPRKPALKILHEYEHSDRESERIWAGEFITEFDMDDTKQGAEKYASKKLHPQ